MKSRFIWILLILTLLCIPTAALAIEFDEYGYNEKACLFVGTLENWDNFLYGLPAAPSADPAATDVVFIERQWNKDFDNLMFHGGDPVNGAYCATNVHTNLSGDQLGWTYHEFFAFSFSFEPIEGALAIDGMPGFYFITYKTWLTDPEGNETMLSDMEADLQGNYGGKLNRIKALTNKNFTFKGNVTKGKNK